MRRVLVYDTTLRDGEQAPGFSMRMDEKLRMVGELEALRVDVIEAGFPACTPVEREASARIAATARETVVAVMARSRRDDIDCCLATVKAARRPRIHVFISTSDLHIRHKLRSTREAAKQAAVEAVTYARNHCDDIQFGCEDATRADRAYLCEIIEAVIAAGARTVTIADTVGATTPADFADLIRHVRDHVANSDRAAIAVHCHDDLGLATANSLAGLAAGARQVECTVNGIGERAGNAALEEIVTALQMRGDAYGVCTNVDATRLVPASRVLESITDVSVAPNKAVVGRNAFRHGAGIHQHGVLLNESLYQFLSAADVGAEPMALSFGKYSGHHAIAHLVDKFALQVTRSQLPAVLDYVKAAAGKRALDEDETAALIQEFINQAVVPAGQGTMRSRT